MSKYLLNFIIFFLLAAVAVLLYQYWWLPKQMTNISSVEGLIIEVIAQGQGPAAQNNDEVSVHYTGFLEDGAKFDSSVDMGAPFQFKLGAGMVIQGWDLGLLGMKAGEKRKLTISPELGYGATGTPGGPIPPNAVLIFEVELLSIN